MYIIKMSSFPIKFKHKTCNYNCITDIFSKIVPFSLQRGVAVDRVEEISEYITRECKKGVVPYLRCIEIGNLNGQKYILDGQHRIRGLKINWDRSHVPIPFTTMEYDAENEQELEYIFKIINESEEFPKQLLEAAKESRELYKKCEEWLQKTYSPIFVYKSSVNRPCVDITAFMKKYTSNYEGETRTLDDFIVRVRQINQTFYTRYTGNESLLNKTKDKVSDTMIEKCKKSGCYIGLHMTEWR